MNIDVVLKKQLKVCIIQSDIVWENLTLNFEKYEALIPTNVPFDLIVLPEMFSSGFSISTNTCAEAVDGLSFKWLQQKAIKTKSAIAASIPVLDNGNFFNRFYFVFPDGTFEFYDKNHLFSYAGEHLSFSAGNKRVIIKYKGWKILPLVCYDLRFPVWNCNRFDNGEFDYDLAIYVANWPSARKHAWNTLLQARAIENQCWVVGANRVGLDGKNIFYSGNSAIINPYGEVVNTMEDNEAALEGVLDLGFLNSYREKFSVSNDWDKF